MRAISCRLISEFLCSSPLLCKAEITVEMYLKCSLEGLSVNLSGVFCKFVCPFLFLSDAVASALGYDQSMKTARFVLIFHGLGCQEFEN